MQQCLKRCVGSEIRRTERHVSERELKQFRVRSDAAPVNETKVEDTQDIFLLCIGIVRQNYKFWRDRVRKGHLGSFAGCTVP